MPCRPDRPIREGDSVWRDVIERENLTSEACPTGIQDDQ